MFFEVNEIKLILFHLKYHDNEDFDFLKSEFPYYNFLELSFSESLYDFLKRTTYKPYEIVFVSDNFELIKSAIMFGLGTVFFGDDYHDYEDIGADYIINNLQKISLILKGEFTNYVGERKSEMNLSYKTTIQNRLAEHSKFIPSIIDLSGNEIHYLGRYFKFSDIRSRKSSYRARIVALKYKRLFEDFFGSLLEQYINFLSKKHDIDDFLLAYVPIKLSQTSEDDKFLNIFNSISKKSNNCNILRTIKDFESQKDLSYMERIKNVEGCFDVTEEISGKTIILFDDILTTGSTLLECINTLKKFNPAKIYVIAFSKTVLVKTDPYKPRKIKCPVCGKKLDLKFITNRAFSFSCYNYKESESEHKKMKSFYSDMIIPLNQDNDLFNLNPHVKKELELIYSLIDF